MFLSTHEYNSAVDCISSISNIVTVCRQRTITVAKCLLLASVGVVAQRNCCVQVLLLVSVGANPILINNSLLQLSQDSWIIHVVIPIDNKIIMNRYRARNSFEFDFSFQL